MENELTSGFQLVISQGEYNYGERKEETKECE